MGFGLQTHLASRYPPMDPPLHILFTHHSFQEVSSGINRVIVPCIYIFVYFYTIYKLSIIFNISLYSI